MKKQTGCFALMMLFLLTGVLALTIVISSLYIASALHALIF